MKKSLALIAVLGLLFLFQKSGEVKKCEPELETCGSDGQTVVEEENVEGIFFIRL